MSAVYPMSIAALIRRAKAETGTADTPDPWPSGARVAVELPLASLFGRVSFADGDWIHWCEDRTGASHATPSKYVRRIT